MRIQREAKRPLTSKLGFFISVLALLLLGATGCGDSASAPKLSQPDSTGRELVTEFLTILQRADRAELDAFLDPSFQIQRADGTGADKSTYLQSPATVTSFTVLPELEARQNDDVLTVRWSIEVDELVNGSLTLKGQAPRLSTFHWTGKRWQLLSHANFNLPS